VQIRRDLDIAMNDFLKEENVGKEKASIFQLTFKQVGYIYMENCSSYQNDWLKKKKMDEKRDLHFQVTFKQVGYWSQAPNLRNL